MHSHCKDWDDNQWIERLVKDDDEAAVCLWEMVYTWATYVLEGKLKLNDVAWDFIVEDGALEAWLKIQAVCKQDPKRIQFFRVYCKQVVRHKIIDKINNWNRRYPSQLISFVEGDEGQDNEDTTSTSRQLGEADSALLNLVKESVLAPCWEQLRLIEQQVLTLYYQEDMSYKDIATALEEKAGTIGKIKYDALLKLKKCLLNRLMTDPELNTFWNRLNPSEQKILQLRFLQNKKGEEIAVVIDLPVDNVEKNIHSALAHISAILTAPEL